MTAEKRAAIRQFINDWKDGGRELQDDQTFWNELLRNIYDVKDLPHFIEYQKEVKINNQCRIDAYIPSTSVLIEQKSSTVDLSKGIPQSDKSYLTPFQQARRYASYLPHNENPRWIIVCNFLEFQIHDMNRPNDEAQIVKLADLEKEYHRMNFLVDTGDENTKRELEISMDAGRIVGELYDALLAQYNNPDDPETLKSLNMLCVRLVFCLYAEDAGVFGVHGMFHDYLKGHAVKDVRRALIDLFEVLNTKPEDRDPYMDEDLLAFPYVNGGLFADSHVVIPRLDEHIVDLILQRASANFDWSEISPTIFGAVFESTLNPVSRRAGGMHYTSIENIHKVIDPLFLDDLRTELAEIQEIKVVKTRKQKLRAFQNKLAQLTFLDPACGSGNFLTETYLSLRRLENEVLRSLSDRISLFGDSKNPIKVSINQFYGIEINDFAVTVAKAALWIAESQMMKETMDIIRIDLDYLPLETQGNIVEDNALSRNWETVVPKHKLNYIMGNPPFIGNTKLSDEQKKDREKLFKHHPGDIDYVGCWYKKAADYMKGTNISCAFVSTNSICQGQQVYPLWKPLMDNGLRINFAYTAFKWDSEASDSASVFCIIVSFSYKESKIKRLFQGERELLVDNINAYLMPYDNIIVKKTRTPLMNVPKAIKGLQPTDNNNLLLSDKEKEELINKEPGAIRWIRPFIAAQEYIKGEKRWCLWLKSITPAELDSLPLIKERVKKCHEWRKRQKQTGDAYKLKDSPTLMRPSKQFVEGEFIVLPRHSSEQRKYIPIGFEKRGSIPGDSVSIIPTESRYLFGVLCSYIHMEWLRTVSGRIKDDYRYATDIVYNTFPWPTPTDAQKAKIEETAQAILDARNLYPDSSLEFLYNELTMPGELRMAHVRNDQAVAVAYGLNRNSPEFKSKSACVAMLMKMYQNLTEKS